MNILQTALMFRLVRELDLTSLIDALPQFLITALILLTFSIIQGLVRASVPMSSYASYQAARARAVLAFG